MPGLTDTAVFTHADELADRVLELGDEAGLPHRTIAEAVTSLLAELVGQPNTVFETRPEYTREVSGEGVVAPQPVVRSKHGFFDVVKARASRRDFSDEPMDLPRLVSLLAWTFGRRGVEIAYDFRDCPLRFIPSAGGLASTDGYVIANNVADLDPGSYYYDYERGLVPLVHGHMAQKVASLVPGSDWIARSAAVVVCVVNTQRVDHKYGNMAAKLGLLDAGVALGHLELVATALELRGCLLGGLPAKEMAHLLDIDDPAMVPMGALAVGSRGRGHDHA